MSESVYMPNKYLINDEVSKNIAQKIRAVGYQEEKKT